VFLVINFVGIKALLTLSYLHDGTNQSEVWTAWGVSHAGKFLDMGK
jgi:hypothetical protein